MAAGPSVEEPSVETCEGTLPNAGGGAMAPGSNGPASPAGTAMGRDVKSATSP
jgi:hypothetical protein